MTADGCDTSSVQLEQLRSGGTDALATMFGQYHQELARMISFRMDRRLYGRLDASDVLQEVYLDAVQRLDGFIQDPQVPFRVWLRQVAGQTLINVHRRHLHAQKRNAALEANRRFPQASSVSLAAHLIGHLTSPSQAAMKSELAEQLERALEEMDEMDREVLVLRHFEELSNQETAAILGLQKAAASNRYMRALKRLKVILNRIPGVYE